MKMGFLVFLCVCVSASFQVCVCVCLCLCVCDLSSVCVCAREKPYGFGGNLGHRDSLATLNLNRTRSASTLKR